MTLPSSLIYTYYLKTSSVYTHTQRSFRLDLFVQRLLRPWPRKWSFNIMKILFTLLTKLWRWSGWNLLFSCFYLFFYFWYVCLPRHSLGMMSGYRDSRGVHHSNRRPNLKLHSHSLDKNFFAVLSLYMPCCRKWNEPNLVCGLLLNSFENKYVELGC